MDTPGEESSGNSKSSQVDHINHNNTVLNEEARFRKTSRMYFVLCVESRGKEIREGGLY